MAVPGPLKNQLLKALTPRDLESIAADLQLVTITLRQTLCEAGAPLQYVFFPENSLGSVITTMTDGAMAEVGMIGAEGMIGLPALLGTGISAHQVIVQMQGEAYRMEAARCKALFDDNAIFRDATLRFFECFINLAGQTAACNRLHSIEQRCSRWLLMAADRVQSDTFSMTHEFLSAMLGARRASVTETAGSLQRAGLIRYHHGKLAILDRAGLERTACECYRIDHTRLVNLQKR